MINEVAVDDEWDIASACLRDGAVVVARCLGRSDRGYGTNNPYS